MDEMQNKSFGEKMKAAWEDGCRMGRSFSMNREELRREIAGRVRKCRTNARLTQEEISEIIDVNALTYKGYENCRSDIPMVYLVRLADYYETSLDYLAGRTADKEEQFAASVKDRVKQLEAAGLDTDGRIAQLEKLVNDLIMSKAEPEDQ